MRAPAGAVKVMRACDANVASPGPPVLRATKPGSTPAPGDDDIRQSKYASANAACGRNDFQALLTPFEKQDLTTYVPALADDGHAAAMTAAQASRIGRRRITVRIPLLRSMVRLPA
jgi:hypothetical protein